MTCIVAVRDDNGLIVMGGDSAGFDSTSYIVTARKDPKVFKRGSYIIGFTTSFRMGQILMHCGSLPDPIEGVDVHAFMAKNFVKSVRHIFHEEGYTDENITLGGDFMVGVKGRLFTIYSDFQVAEACDDYATIGCGAQVALGSLYATAGNALHTRVKSALEAAEKHNGGVRAPFLILTHSYEVNK